MKKRVFTKEEISNIIYDYTVNNFGQKKLAKKYCTNARIIKKLLIDNGIVIKTVQETNITHYHIKEDFFDNENSEMAYMLGLLASDGCVSSKENCVYIELQENDSELLETLNKIIENGRPVAHYVTSRGYHNCKLYFFSRHIKDRLAYYNIIPNKTTDKNFTFPVNLNKKYWIDYIRGYFDGDGSVKGTGKYQYLTFQIDGASKSLLEYIQQFLSEEYGINTNIILHNEHHQDNYNRTTPLYRLYCYSTEANKVFEAMYYNNDQIRLERKYNKYISLKK